MDRGSRTLVEHSTHDHVVQALSPEAVFLVMCDPSMNEL